MPLLRNRKTMTSLEMADEIDIEEHDLLDNPQIKRIFPDLTVLKQEIENCYDEAQETNLKSVYVFGSRPENSVTNIDTVSEKRTDSFKVENDGPTLQDISEDNILKLPINRNKIILGTKPNKQSENEEFSKTRLKPNKVSVGDVGPFSRRNKPSKQLEYDEFVEKQLKADGPKVILDNLGPYLKRSDRFCEDCLTLFSTKNALDDHKATHSSQGISQPLIKRNKSKLSYQYNYIKCKLCYTYFSTRGSLQRHYKNIHAKDVESNEQIRKLQKVNNSKDRVPNTNNLCVHCKISFPTQQSLIDHLYEVLQPQRISSKKGSEEFSSEDKLKEHNMRYIHDKGKVKGKEKVTPTNYSPKLTINRNNKFVGNAPKKINIREKFRKEENASILGTKKLTPKGDNKNTKSTNILKNKTIKGRRENTNIKKKRMQEMAPEEEKNILQTQTKSINRLYYSCYKCSYYFTNSKLCLAHLVKKHKVTKIIYPRMVSQPYNPKCKYCFLKFTCVPAYNTHLKEIHSQQYCSNVQNNGQDKKDKPNVIQESKPKLTKTSNFKPEKCEYKSLVLKSTLFKCNKCDINFLSAKTAMNHIDHMDILINWKCSACQRIFKKQDELLHMEQHSLCHKFVVIDLSALSRVLYKCPKCAIHFTEENFLIHYSVCGMKIPDSVYCRVCDILIVTEISRSHEASHQYENLKLSDFTIVESDIIPNKIKCRGRPTLKEQVKKANELKRKTVDNANVSPSENKKKKELDYMFDMAYCNTCKCFLTDRYKGNRNVHVEGRCGHLVKYVCKICGLVLTAKAYQTHKGLHSRMRNLKLQDFNFYALHSVEKIYPPIPVYPQCQFCDVHFLSKPRSLSHKCGDEDYLTCHLCNLKFSEESYKLHLLFHNYSNINLDKVEDAFSKSVIGKNITESDSLSQPAQNSGLVSKSFEASNNALEVVENNLDLAKYLFCCKNCDVTVDTYDKVIEHCQWHYCREQKEIHTEICHFCNLKFESTCYENHQMLHSSLIGKESFNLCNFDTFYFRSDNDVWIKHVFGSLPKEEIEFIINKSIYKFECRIKMEVIQDGPSNFTMYKCDNCRCYISGSSLYNHAENSCFKLRKHLCSFCGLPFISSMSRMEHEKIHNGSSVGLKSYRIVIFNREEDKYFNNALHGSPYVLYQCRNCCGVVDKSQTNKHECNKSDLKKCSRCGLVLNSEYYETHKLRHTDLKNFTQDNMKVILFGEKTETDEVDQEELASSFNGTVYDYAFYSCTRCQICVKTFKCTLKHICAFGLSRLLCPSCDLYFTTNRMKYHRKLHETDPDFVNENMKIIAFNTPESNDSEADCQEPLKEQSVTGPCTKNATIFEEHPNTSSLTDSKIDGKYILIDGKKTNNDAHESVEAIAKIFKCTCGLHFLDQSSMSTHFKICNPRIRASKQKCTKCDLLFTPNILFSHLLMHHGNRELVFKFEIIEMTKNKDFLYKCSRCQLHFVKETEVKEHLKICNASGIDGKKCINCNLIFEHSSLILHENNHIDVQREYEIITIDEPLLDASQDDLKAQNMRKPQFDIVKTTDSNLVLNENKLAQTELSNYSETIYKCRECSIHFLTIKSMRLHLSGKHDVLAKLQDICNICGLNFISSKLAKHIDIHHNKLKLKPTDLVVVECVEDI